MDNNGLAVKMSKPRAVLMAITIWLTSFTVMWQLSEVVIINDLYTAFPDQSGLVTAILSWPALVTAAVGFLSGAMLKKVSTKFELILAGILMLFGIIAPVGANIYVVTVCSFLMAAGAGFANTAGMAIISEVFLDEKTRNAQMGYYNTVMSICGILITFLAGVLAVNGWTYAFRVNWFAVVMLIMTILFLPDIKPGDRVSSAEEETASESGSKKGFGAKFWVFFISMFFFFMSYSCFFSYISAYVAENKLGDTAFVGTCSSLTTVGSMIACFIFGAMYAKMHRKISLLYVILPLLMYIWAWQAPSRIACILFSVIYGFSYGGIFTEVYAYAAEIVSIESNGMAMGLMTLNYSIAITLGVNIFAVLMGKAGTLTATFPVAIGMLAVTFVIELISSIGEKKQKV